MKHELFTVTIQTEIVVIAEDAPHAQRTANFFVREAWGSLASNYLHFSFAVQPMRKLPAGYTLDEYPYENTVEQPELLEEPDRPIEEWVALGAAPFYDPTVDSDRRELAHAAPPDPISEEPREPESPHEDPEAIRFDPLAEIWHEYLEHQSHPSSDTDASALRVLSTDR